MTRPLSEREARAAASRTPELDGTPIRTLGTAQGFVAVLVLGLVLVVGSLFATRLGLAYALLLPTLLLFVVWYLRAVRIMRLNNEGVLALLRGDDATATARFRDVVRRRAVRESAAMGLHNLGVVALRARRPKSAVEIFRAALAVAAGGLRFRRTPTAVDALVRSHLAFALAAIGELDEGELVAGALSGNRVVEHLPMAIAYAARARALLALKRGKPDEALGILDDERALLSSVLTGSESMLADAMRAVALAAQGKSAPPAWVDEEGARFVFAYLPEAKDHVAWEDREGV